MPVKKGDDWGRGTAKLKEENNDGAFEGEAVADSSQSGKPMITDRTTSINPRSDKPTSA